MRCGGLNTERIGGGEMRGNLKRTKGSRPSRRSFRQDRGMIGASSGTNLKAWDQVNSKNCLAGRRPQTWNYPRLERDEF